LSIMIIYNSTCSMLIQWIRVACVYCQATMWISKRKRKCTFCLCFTFTLSLEQKKTCRKGRRLKFCGTLHYWFIHSLTDWILEWSDKLIKWLADFGTYFYFKDIKLWINTHLQTYWYRRTINLILSKNRTFPNE